MMTQESTALKLIICICFFATHLTYGSDAPMQRPQARTLLFPPTSPTRIQFIGGIGIPVENLNYESITSGYVLKAEYFLPTQAQQWQKTYLRPQTIHRRSLNETYFILQQQQQQQQQQKQQHEHEHEQYNKHSNRQRNESTEFIVNEANQQFGSELTAPPLPPSSSPSPSPSPSAPASALYRWIIYQAIEQLLQRNALPGRECLLRCICEHAAVPLHFGAGILAETLHIILSPASSQEPLVKSAHNAYYAAERLGRATADDGAACAQAYRGCRRSPLDDISAIFAID